jgi:hypothetical protein
MAGLVPAIHAFFVVEQNVDARHKAGHDEFADAYGPPLTGEKCVQRSHLPPHARVFLAKPGAARYQVRAFSAPLADAPHGPPQ